MRTTIQIRSNPVGDAVLNASRQVWLASLGAAVVTRDWAQSEYHRNWTQGGQR